jgi:hypothetical protein
MSVIIDGTAGITFPNSTTQAVAGAPLTTPSFTTTIGVGAATASASGVGITFPATQSASTDANTLDDYEEGTFSPVYSPQSGAFTTLTYFAQNGRYTKIGNIVFFELNVFTNSVTVGTASGQINISGLPFTSDSTSQLHPAPALGRVYRWANAISNMRAYIGAGGSQISFSSMATNAAFATEVQVSEMTTGSNTAYNCLDITGCYKIA